MKAADDKTSPGKPRINGRADLASRCLMPLIEFCEWTPGRHPIGKGRPIKGEMWFAVPNNRSARWRRCGNELREALDARW